MRTPAKYAILLPPPPQWNGIISGKVQKSMGNYSSVSAAPNWSVLPRFQAVQPTCLSVAFAPKLEREMEKVAAPSRSPNLSLHPNIFAVCRCQQNTPRNIQMILNSWYFQVVDKHGMTPLLSAIYEGHKECVSVLLKHVSLPSLYWFDVFSSLASGKTCA